jgi:hypothetical protein
LGHHPSQLWLKAHLQTSDFFVSLLRTVAFKSGDAPLAIRFAEDSALFVGGCSQYFRQFQNRCGPAKPE